MVLAASMAVCLMAVFPGISTVEQTLSEYVSLPFDPSLQLAQTFNNCGPYSVMAVLNSLTGKKYFGEDLATEMRWRVQKNLTLPQGVLDLLNRYGIITRPFSTQFSADKERISVLKSCLSRSHPVVLLIEVHHIQHYVTLLGYKGNTFYAYDSLQWKTGPGRLTVDDNGPKPGNRTWSAAKLLQLWSEGGKWIFYRYYGIECIWNK